MDRVEDEVLVQRVASGDERSLSGRTQTPLGTTVKSRTTVALRAMREATRLNERWSPDE
jgi:hypothetical protein